MNKTIRFFIAISLSITYTVTLPDLSSAQNKNGNEDIITIEKENGGKKRIRDYGIEYGIFKTGKNNAITDVKGVKVGHITLNEGSDKRTGVTAILPHDGNLFQKKTPAAIYIGNGFGKLAGISQVQELGNIETPIVLTNTLSIAAGLDGIITYTLKNNERVYSINGIVGETNDSGLNNIIARYVKPEHVVQAIESATDGPVQEGVVGAGTGTVAFGWKGGIGTSSRVLPKDLGGYTIGVLVQSNYGGALEIDGVQIGKLLGHYSFQKSIENEALTEEEQNGNGSCMIIVATDAPLDSRQLERVAKRAFMALAKTGSSAANGSGDYVIAFSNYSENLIGSGEKVRSVKVLSNDEISPIFAATVEATAEALWNSLFAANSVEGERGGVPRKVEQIPVDKIIELIKKSKNIDLK